MQGKDLSRLLAGTSLIMEHLVKQSQRQGNLHPIVSSLAQHFPLRDASKKDYPKSPLDNVKYTEGKETNESTKRSQTFKSQSLYTAENHLDRVNMTKKVEKSTKAILRSTRSKNRGTRQVKYNQSIVERNQQGNIYTSIHLSQNKNTIQNELESSSKSDSNITEDQKFFITNQKGVLSPPLAPSAAILHRETLELERKKVEQEISQSFSSTHGKEESVNLSSDTIEKEKILDATIDNSPSSISPKEELATADIPSSNLSSSTSATETKPFSSSSSENTNKNTGDTLPRREMAVPSTPLGRVLGFGGLAARLAIGTMYEAVIRNLDEQVGNKNQKDTKDFNDSDKRKDTNSGSKLNLMSEANAERLAETLCRMRGAALKLGQMLSIQDENVLPEALVKALERVRQGADVMPRAQLHQQLVREFGENWRSQLLEFDEEPLAAASIGQVHKAVLHNGRKVVMKIQYPGVADSIDSDLYNLKTLVSVMNFLPPGLYIDEIISVAKEELTRECDYKYEADNQKKFRELILNDSTLNCHVIVPEVIPELSTTRILTSEYMEGVAIDKVANLDQSTRNQVADIILNLSMKELFQWRFMQTDPNWGNFLFDQNTNRLALIDFGAAREYSKEFVDNYLELVWSAANQDTDVMMSVSRKMGFLTGDESSQMMDAHRKAGLVVGEPFVQKIGSFDFVKSNMTTRISTYGDTFMRHRLTPPPREAYSLHRKLAGAFLICIKLQAIIPCRPLLERIYKSYKK